jgi:8-oxo-dGTP pyrophosphatase MutT (NUDIX family)
MNSPELVEKVTAFVTRESQGDFELLLLEHPFCGIQIPAGTIEPDEDPETAVRREVIEETGLENLIVRQYLGYQDEMFPEQKAMILQPTRVYARPDDTSFDWAFIRSGITVDILRSAANFKQISYVEYDRVPDPNFITMSIIGWVPEKNLARTCRRYFFHLEYQGESRQRWQIYADDHVFTAFWKSLDALPQIVPPQDKWLILIRSYLSEKWDIEW